MRPTSRLRRRRRPAQLLLAALGLSVTAPVVVAGTAASQPEPPSEPMVVIEGRGFGHGVGMGQDGALAMGLDGASTADILQHFYPGTTLGQAGGDVRVAVLTAPGPTVLGFPGGGEVRSVGGAPGFPVSVAAGGSVRVSFDGAYRAEPLSGAAVSASAVAGPVPLRAPAASEPAAPDGPAPDGPAPEEPAPDDTAPDGGDGGLLGGDLLGSGEPPAPPPSPPPPPTPPPGGEPPAPGAPGEAPPPEAEPVDVPVSASPLRAVPASGTTVAVAARSARYRGTVDVSAGGGGLRLVNEVGVEDYLRGMGEVRDSSWPQASLGAQAVAARTYALRAMAISGELCDTQDCQVYLGQQAEYAAMDAAVNATRGQVVRFGGALAQTVYSASGGGVSATPEEGFGTSGGGLSYLGALAYPTRNPQAWNVRIPLRELGRRLSYPGTLHEVRIAASGPSGRPLSVTLAGDAGARELAALQFRDRLGLRSTLWTLRVEGPPASSGPPAAAGGPAAAGDAGRANPVVADTGTQGRSLLSGDTSVATIEALRLPPRAALAVLAALLLISLYGALAYRVVLNRSLRSLRSGELDRAPAAGQACRLPH